MVPRVGIVLSVEIASNARVYWALWQNLTVDKLSKLSKMRY